MRLALAALLALTALRLWLAASLKLAPDEAYYFMWSTHLQGGYFDHPPMVALWIKAGTALCGHTALGVRLLGPVSAALGSLLVWDAGERLLPHRHAGLAAALLLNATLLVGVGAIIMTPDTPLLFFWSCGLAALARLVAAGNARWWLAVGLAAGGMLLSKYTAALFISAVFLWLVFTPAMRPQLRTPWPWAAMALAALLFAPDIAWNAAHGWASYFKQGGRVAQFDAARAAQFFVELLGSQAALFTPGVLALAGLGLWRLRGEAAPGAKLLLWLTLLPAAVFLEHVLSDRVQGNWVAILYPAACLAAALLPPGRWLKPALGLGYGLTALAYLQAATAAFPIPARMDTAALQLSGWQALAQEAAATHPAFLTADDYATAATMAFYAPKDVPVLGFDKRWAYFDWPQSGAGETGIMVTRRPEAECPQELGRISRKRGAEVIATYRLCRFTAPYPGMALPRP